MQRRRREQNAQEKNANGELYMENARRESSEVMRMLTKFKEPRLKALCADLYDFIYKELIVIDHGDRFTGMFMKLADTNLRSSLQRHIYNRKSRYEERNHMKREIVTTFRDVCQASDRAFLDVLIEKLGNTGPHWENVYKPPYWYLHGKKVVRGSKESWPVHCPYECTVDANWEAPESVDYEGLLKDIERLFQVLLFAEKLPASLKLSQGGEMMRSGMERSSLNRNRPCYIVVEGFLIYADPLVCRTFDVAIWLHAPKEISATRFLSRRHCNNKKASQFDESSRYTDVVWPEFLKYRPRQLVNAFLASILMPISATRFSMEIVEDVVANISEMPSCYDSEACKAGRIAGF